MIGPERFVERLNELGVSMFVGVPDSLLKPFSQYVMNALPPSSHIITADEGAAVGVALGHYLATSDPALVYLQNSGFGNTVNPLLSLADPEVYGVPMVLLVGWRGQPGVADEPQHVKQGRVMTTLIDAMEIPYAVLPSDQDAALACIEDAVDTARHREGPFVVLVEKGTFATVSAGPEVDEDQAELPSREDAVGALAAHTGADSVIVSTTGMLSRELFELRERDGADGSRDFLTVGGMGHASAIALGVAQSTVGRDVWCFDGDGALLMHMGTMANIAHHAASNYHHVVFNNGVHDSVGGQPTSIRVVDVEAAAHALGYSWAATTDSLDDLESLVEQMQAVEGPTLLEIRVKPGARDDLGRPTRTPRESRERFVAAIADS